MEDSQRQAQRKQHRRPCAEAEAEAEAGAASGEINAGEVGGGPTVKGSVDRRAVW